MAADEGIFTPQTDQKPPGVKQVVAQELHIDQPPTGFILDQALLLKNENGKFLDTDEETIREFKTYGTNII